MLDEKLIVVRILQDLAEFADPADPTRNLHLQKEDVLTLDGKTAETLIKNGVAVKVEQTIWSKPDGGVEA